MRAEISNPTSSPSRGLNPTAAFHLNLCRQHCEIGNQSLTADAYVSVPASMLMTMLVTVVEPLQSASAFTLTSLPVPRERETGPPPLVRFHFYRI